jgi:glycosyltransferase involved in cell wall biosynthesis
VSEITQVVSAPTHRTNKAKQAHVVFLVNFLSPNLLPVFREVAKHIGRLDILVSVTVEANRNWKPDFGELNVIVQKTWTSRRLVNHPGGYQEELFVHFPIDTLAQLRRLKPDCVVSLEMGTRSLLSSIYRRFWNRTTRHVLAVYGSERSEAGRGRVRQWLRKRLLESADVITFNGPSCQRYLKSMGARIDRMTPWNYAADPSKFYRDGLVTSKETQRLRLLTVSQLIPRKGIMQAAESLNAWAMSHNDRLIEWAIAGTGPQFEDLNAMPRASNLRIDLMGHRDAKQLQELYRDFPCHLFPTLGDEWGLVVDEALASGQLVLASIHSQAAETLIEHGKNGWLFNPEQEGSLHTALNALANVDASQTLRMRQYARESVEKRTPLESAQQFVAAVELALR